MVSSKSVCDMNEELFDKIEAYLLGQLTPEQDAAFEQELNQSEELRQETQRLAYVITSIYKVGLAADNKLLADLRASIPGDKKRFVMTAAASVVVALAACAAVTVPVYKHVVKPIIEKYTAPRKAPAPAPTTIPTDTIAFPVDTLQVDTIEQEVPVAPPVHIAPVKPTPEPVVEPDTLPEVSPEPVEEEAPAPAEPETPLPANRIVSTSQLENYTFSEVTVSRVKDNVVCSFTMVNEVENAEIEMHSARARDNNGKDYHAKSCLLNGKDKRIKEQWQQGEVHDITITIKDVPTDITGFKQISFSFQSAGDSLKQKSKSIILTIGEIN